MTTTSTQQQPFAEDTANSDVDTIQAYIWSCLNCYNYEDAIFLSEWLFAEDASEYSLFLLATCYYRSGQVMSAYTLLKKFGVKDLQAKYLLARCCLDLSLPEEAEEVLMETNSLDRQKSPKDFIQENQLLGSFALGVLGRIFSQTNREEKAAEFLTESIRANSLLWSSFSLACALGGNLESSKAFVPMKKKPTAKPPIKVSNMMKGTPLNGSAAKNPIQMGNLARVAPMSTRSGSSGCVSGSNDPSVFETPDGAENSGVLAQPLGVTPASAYIQPPTKVEFGDSKAPVKAPRKFATRRSTTEEIVAQSQNMGNMTVLLAQNQVITRRSSRLFQASIKENSSAKPPRNQNMRTTANNSRKTPRLRKSENESVQEINEINKQHSGGQKNSNNPIPLVPLNDTQWSSSGKAESEANLTANDHYFSQERLGRLANFQGMAKDAALPFLEDFGEIEKALAQFDCQRAIQLIGRLPLEHKQSGWALSALGRAYFEICQYEKAIETYSSMRRIAPHYLNGVELYSSALWFRAKEVELSALAQDLTGNFRLAPETWCAAGNCFSLQNEHETAIKFLKRAIQVKPDFAYAYTLLGHEYILIDETDQAMQCFRSAIRYSPKHYNAWYGIGQIYHQRGNLKEANIHYRRALTVNPRNPVLMCHISRVQQELHHSDAALTLLDQALAFAPRNPLCLYNRALVLFAQDQFEDALQECEELKQIVPREAKVYFLAGKIHKKLGQTHLALMNFSWATDLDPKGGAGPSKYGSEQQRYEEEPVTALAAMELEDVGEIQAMDSDESV